VGEEEVTTFVVMLSDSSVEGNDLSMFRFSFGHELLQNVLLISFQLFSSVGKGEEIVISGNIECDSPVTMGDNRF
jgi:hypothetical protein